MPRGLQFHQRGGGEQIAVGQARCRVQPWRRARPPREGLQDLLLHRRLPRPQRQALGGLHPALRRCSSTDNQEHDRVNHRPSYWSSGGQDDSDMFESLTYRLISDLCIIHEIRLQPFQVYFQRGDRIYSSKAVRFRMGRSKLPCGWESFVTDEDDNVVAIADGNYVWTYTSPVFPMLQICPENAANLISAEEKVSRSPPTAHVAESSHGVELKIREREYRTCPYVGDAIVPTTKPSVDCILRCIGASSTDNFPDESIEDTLVPQDWVKLPQYIWANAYEDDPYAFRPSYWPSGGHDDPDSTESLTYGLMSEMCY